MQLYKEKFTGSYDGVTNSLLLPAGAISSGKNIRKVSKGGGWKVRKGCVLHNTTAVDSTNGVDSLQMYKNPKQSDVHFLAQCNNLLYDSTTDPPTAGTTFGTSLGIAVGTTPGFSAVVGENMFYADGSGRPVVYSGATPFCRGFLCHYDVDDDDTPEVLVSYTREVTDGNTATGAVLRNDIHDVYYVCSEEKASGIVVTLGSTVNAVTATCAVASWVAGAWDTRSTGFSDGTLASGKTHAQSGTISWTLNSTDTMSVLGGIMGYWYKVSFSAAPTVSTSITACQVVFPASLISNKWNSVYSFVSAARLYIAATSEYRDITGAVTNESMSQVAALSDAVAGDYLYIKVPEPATGFGLGIPDGGANTTEENLDQIDVWNGTSWTAITTGITDETAASTIGFSHSGTIWFNAAAVIAKRRVFDWDSTPGYWYRLSWDATLGGTTSIYMLLYAPFPEALGTTKGVVEFKNRLVCWGDPAYPNRLRISAQDAPTTFCGADSIWSEAFGDATEIKAVVPFYNELLVAKENSIWLFEGYNPSTFGSLRVADTIGLASPKSLKVIETGYPAMHKDEPLSVAIWQEVDGVYVLDGRKPRKVSASVDQYFNPENSSCVAAASIGNRQAFVDPINNEYHLLLPTVELVYNVVNDEWYPAWERALPLVCGIELRGTDGRKYIYGGTSGGFVCQLESDTTDKSAANADVAITHSIRSRALTVAPDPKGGTTQRFTFRKVWAELKARTTPTAKLVTVNTYRNQASSGTALGTMSLAASGYSLTTPMLGGSVADCDCIEIEFYSATADLEIEVASMLVEFDARGELGG